MAFVPDQPSSGKFTPDAPEEIEQPKMGFGTALAIQGLAALLPGEREKAKEPEAPKPVSAGDRKEGVHYTRIPGEEKHVPRSSKSTDIEDKYVEDTVTPNVESWSASTLGHLSDIKKSMMAYPGMAAQFAKTVYEQSMRNSMTDTHAKELGFKNTEEYLDKEREAFKEKALQNANVVEQVVGGLLAQAVDPVAIATARYGLTNPVGFARNLKLAAGGASYTGGLEALEQVAEDGTITSPMNVIANAFAGGVGVPILDKAIRVGAKIRTEGMLKRVERYTKHNIETGKMNPDAAYDKALFDSGINEREIASMIDGTGRTQHFPNAFDPLKRPELLKILRARGYTPAQILKMSKHDPIEGYIKATNQNGILANLSNATSTITSHVGSAIDNLIQPTSSALRKISPALLNGLRRNELHINLDTNEWRAVVEPFMKITSGFDKKTYDAMHKALINRDEVTARKILNTLPNKDEALKAKDAVDTLMDSIHSKFKQVGVDMNHLDKYFPRLLKKGRYKTLTKELGADPRSPFAQLLKKKETDKAFKKDFGRHVAEQEDAQGIAAGGLEAPANLNAAGMKDDFRFGWEPRREPLTEREMNNLLNSYLKGITPEGLRQPSAAKSRVLETVPDNLLHNYGSIEDMLTSYIDHAAHTINIRKFFGKHIMNDKDIDADVNGSIGSFVNELFSNGEIHLKDIDSLKDLLGARFGYKPTGEFNQDIKNVFYMTRLGQFKAAVTQFGDLGVSSYVNGLFNTIEAFYKVGKNYVGGKELPITRKRIAVTKVAEEFGTTSKTANALNHVFKYSGFKSVDNLGKDTFLNASLLRNEKMVNSAKGIEQFKKKWEPYFADETGNLIEDLQKGKMTENVKLLMFNELSDVQPVSLLEMPPAYLKSPNGRMFYAMKTFTIKQLDLIRRDSIAKIRNGEVEGVTNLARYMMMVTAANLGADKIKASIAGQDIDYSDAFVANLWRNFGASSYLVNMASDQKKPFAAIGEALLSNPWVGTYQVGDTLYQDLRKFSGVMDMDSWKYVPAFKGLPGGGQWMYNLFGGGAEKYAEEQRLKRNRGAVDEDELEEEREREAFMRERMKR